MKKLFLIFQLLFFIRCSSNVCELSISLDKDRGITFGDYFVKIDETDIDYFITHGLISEELNPQIISYDAIDPETSIMTSGEYYEQTVLTHNIEFTFNSDLDSINYKLEYITIGISDDTCVEILGKQIDIDNFNLVSLYGKYTFNYVNDQNTLFRSDDLRLEFGFSIDDQNRTLREIRIY